MGKNLSRIILDLENQILQILINYFVSKKVNCIDVQGIQPYLQAQATLAAVVGLTDRYLRPVPC